MKAYGDRVILKMITSSNKGIEVGTKFPQGEVISIGHVLIASPSSEEDPLKQGDIVVLDPNAVGVDVEYDGEDYKLFRKMQIMYIK